MAILLTTKEQREIARLKNELEKIKSTQTIESTEISPRERKIIGYIQLNAGINKQKVIDWGVSQSIGSRVTILNAIDKLHKSGIIKIEKDKPNSIVHKLYINRESVLVFLIEELDTFENVFPALIEKIKAKLKGTNLGVADTPFSQNELNFIITFFVLYQQFIGMNVLHAISTWPARLNDEYTLERLYALLFSWLRKIQLNLTNAFKTDKPYNYSVDVSATMAQLWFVLQPSHMRNLRDTAKDYDAVNEVENLLDVVWKVSRPFFRYSLWAHPPPSQVQKDNSKKIPYKDIDEKELHDLSPEDWRGLLKK